jgi:hypothetical protein
MSAPVLIPVEACPRQHPNAAWRELDGAIVIISPEDSVLHELNETAGFVWKHASGQHSIAEIAAKLAEEYEVDSSTALADTQAFVAELCSKGLMLTGPGEACHG